jgi:hypothetical protein
MDVPSNHPTPLYPANYAQSTNSSTATTNHQDSSTLVPPHNGMDTSNLSSLPRKRNQSFLSLASLTHSQSSSSLLGIFSSAGDYIPPTPIPTPPPIEIRRERAIIEEFNKWSSIRDTVRSTSVLFALGYALATYPYHLDYANVDYYYRCKIIMLYRFRISRL